MGLPWVIVNITDNDYAVVTIIPTGGSTDVAEGGASDTYDIVLTKAPTQNVTIQLEHAAGQIVAVDDCNPSTVDRQPAIRHVTRQAHQVAGCQIATERLGEDFRITTTDLERQQATDVPEDRVGRRFVDLGEVFIGPVLLVSVKPSRYLRACRQDRGERLGGKVLKLVDAQPKVAAARLAHLRSAHGRRVATR